jgi:signal transduction histidine kinase/ligand-binding sensor domain-containing protein/DNA-binding response OmpR family regulator
MNIKFLLIYIFILLQHPSFSQEIKNKNQSIKFKHYSLSEGLSQSSVLCIIQDSKGFLWFGTRDGLNKYDGQTFKTYRYNSKDSTSISNSSIKSLFEDKKGNLWIGTLGGLNRYLPNKDTFKRYKYSSQKNSVINNQIWSIAELDNNNLWVGTNAGLDILNTTTDTFSHINIMAQKNSQIRSLYKTTKGDLWICNTDNIIIYSTKTKTYKEYLYPKFDFIDANEKYVPVIYEDKVNKIWLGYKNGLFSINNEQNKFKVFKIKTNNSEKPIINKEVRTIHEDSIGNLWVGSYTGLYIINKEKTKIVHQLHDENNVNSLSQNSIYKILEDTKGDLWIGTYAGGINYYDRNFDSFKYYTSGTNNTKLNYPVVSSIVEEPNGNLWIGTEGGGINFFDKKTETFKYLTHQNGNTKSISTNNVKSIIRTKKGNLWIGTHDGGLNFLNPNIKPYHFIKYKSSPKKSNSISNNRIISLYEDEMENIWVGTSEGGLNIINPKTNKITRINDSLGVIGKIIYDISKTNKKNSLLVAGDKGLGIINIITKKISAINYKLTYEENSTSITLNVYEDKKQNFWIGTEGNGLYYYNPTTKKSIKYGIKEGLPNEVIHGILSDDNNNIWLSTNNGLSKLNTKTQEFINFDVSSGLIGNEFNYNAFVKLKNKNLMFGGVKGITFFNPNKITINKFIPPVFVTSITVNNEIYKSGTDIDNNISLTHNQNVFGFKFIALSYSQSKKNNYAYKLEGFDENWNNIGTDKSVTYTNLDAGNYTFRVKASNYDGVWNEEGDVFFVKILPAPWKTWWAYLIYFLLTILILFIIRKYSVLRIKEKNQLKQERIEKERLEEINQLKLKLFTNISHDLRTPLTLIIGPLERMLQQKLGTDYIKKQHKVIHRNANILLQLINQLLDFRKSVAGKLQLKASQNNIVAFIEECKYSFNELAKDRNIEFIVEASEENIPVWFDKINLRKVLFNLLSNAFKFTENNGKISITISTITKKITKENFITIQVKDNGIGIPKKKVPFIFDRFYQLNQSDENSRIGTGIGLALTKNIIDLHKGQIKVKSKKNIGTKFVISLPLGRKHLSDEEILNNIEQKEKNPLPKDELSTAIKEMDSLKEKADNKNDESKPTILIVEDNVDVRTFIKEVLIEKNNILEAENGKEALKIAKNKSINLIISDVMMPIMNGIDLCNKIKNNILTSHIPVILLTAKTSDIAVKEGFKTGADAYIKKPFDANILEIRVVNLILSRKALIEKYKKDILLEPKKVTIISTDEKFLNKAVKLIEENITNSEFTIQDLIENVGMSRSAFYRKIKALTNQSITEFIRAIKLKRAAQLLKDTDLNISEIAYDLGFNELKNFRKYFKKAFNKLPSEYRNNPKK